MKAIPVMKLNIDDDLENANWLHQMRKSKKVSRTERIKKLALEIIDKKKKVVS